MSQKHSHSFKKPFVTESGYSILSPTMAYQTWGELNTAKDNAVLVCHALTGDTSADVWFGELFGKNNLLDPNEHFIICPNVLGSCYGSTGPTDRNPDTGKKYRMDFPKVTIRDIVKLQQRLLDELQITGIDFIIGGSMGGMQALEWCIMDDRPKAAILIGMGKSHRPWAIGISHTQRKAIFDDPDWKEGFYSDEHPPSNGLALARMIAMNSYRHPLDFDQKFGRKLQSGQAYYQIESYLNYQGKKINKRFDAATYVRLTQAMDSHDVGRGRKSYEEVLGKVTIPVKVIGIDSDLLYTPGECRELSSLLPAGSYGQINSPHGHDAFLIEFDQLKALVEPFLESVRVT